jgi:hypothetical protein
MSCCATGADQTPPIPMTTAAASRVLENFIASFLHEPNGKRCREAAWAANPSSLNEWSEDRGDDRVEDQN